MGKKFETITYCLTSIPVESISDLTMSGYPVTYDSGFKEKILEVLKAKGDLFIPSKNTLTLKEILWNNIAIDEWKNIGGLRPTTPEMIFANCVSFIKSWSKPGGKLHFAYRDMKVYTGLVLADGQSDFFLITRKQSGLYAIRTQSKLFYTTIGDFWIM